MSISHILYIKRTINLVKQYSIDLYPSNRENETEDYYVRQKLLH